MPEFERNESWLKKFYEDMDGEDFWQQRGLICSREGQAESAMDYYRQGLRKNPTSEVLLYSLAHGYLGLRKYKNAI